MKRICIYVTLGLLGAVSAHAQDKYRTSRCPENKR